jgi:hypothetical protein
MKAAIISAVKFIALTVVYFICFSVVSAVVFSASVQADPEQANALGGLFALSILNTALLTFLIRRSRWCGWKLTVAIFVVLFGTATFMSQIETAFFVTRLPSGILPRIFLTGAIIAAIFSPLAVLILGKRRQSASDTTDVSWLQMSPGEWAWKQTLIIVLYLIIYFTFGYFIAWKSAAVRAYYGGSEPPGFLPHMLETLRDNPWLFGLQSVRAVLWTALAVVIIRMLKGGWLEAALAVGLSFAILMNTQLLIPNPYMPYEVRMVHLLEIVTSNFLFGYLLVWLLSMGLKPRRARR